MGSFSDRFGKRGGGNKDGGKKQISSGSKTGDSSEGSSGLVRSSLSGTGSSLAKKGGSFSDRRSSFAEVGETAPTAIGKKEGVFGFCIDATASMHPYIDMVIKNLVGVVEMLHEDAKGATIKLRFAVYRDYGDQPIVEHSDLFEAPEPAIAWLKDLRTHGGGGNNGEAVELGLLELKEFGPYDAIFLAGDEPARERKELDLDGGRDSPTPFDVAMGMDCQVHTYVVPGHPNEDQTRTSFAKISQLTDGATGDMDLEGKTFIGDTVAGIIASIKGVSGLKDLVQKLQSTKQLTDGTEKFIGQLMLPPGGRKKG